MSVTPTAFTHTLGTDLERDRLERRVSRMTFAIASLRQRASEYRRELSSPPRQLRQVIADFEAQIDEINARLHDLAREPASVEPSNERDHMTTITDGDTGLLRRLIPPPSKEAT